jgi:hypothetical protein
VAQPFITLATEASVNPTGVNLSNVTSPGGAWTALQGITGADWLAATGDHKKEGQNQLAVTYSPGASTSANFFFPMTWVPAAANGEGDAELLPVIRSGTSNVTIYNGRLGDYIRQPNIIADQKQRKYHFQGSNQNGGTWVLTATLSDGSYAPQQITLPVGDFGITCTFTARTVCTLQISVDCTVASGFGVNQAYLYHGCWWLEVPVEAKLPTGYKKFLLARKFGGANV